MRLQFLFFLPAVLAWWNCELPIGTGDNGRCIDGTTGNWDACSASKEMGAALKAAELRTVLKRLRWHWVTC
ncbi:hypothetical protein QSH57_003942 [Fusarium oxysporum f. sp. vasinfectum]|nr:hypothetical protein QSH57_003942 [Fusarium oxysporum f. sp. vasinfectum]